MKSPSASSYQNVTITGKVGVGKTTLTENLKSILIPLGWTFYSVSQLQRDWIKANNIPLEQTILRPDDHEREMEAEVKRKLTEETHVVIDGWLAGFMAQGVEGVLKVLMICSDDAVRIDRVANRDGVTIEEAKKLIKEREKQNAEKWQAIYGPHDFWDPKLYDLVIDTYSVSKQEAPRIVLERLGI